MNRPMNPNRQRQSVPWAPILGGAALGAVALLVANRIRSAQSNQNVHTLDSAVKACDDAVSALESRLGQSGQQRRFAS